MEDKTETLILNELLKEGFTREEIYKVLGSNKGYKNSYLKTVFDLRWEFFSKYTENFFQLWRLSIGFTIREFAQMLNLSYATIRKWENGTRNTKSSYKTMLENIGYVHVKIMIPNNFFDKSIKQIEKWR